MSQGLLAKGKKHFIWNNTLEVEFSGSTMEDCRIKLENTFFKILSGNKVAVFGNYVIYILYSNAQRNRKVTYYARSGRTAFCEIIPCECVSGDSGLAGGDDIKIELDFLDNPECKYDFHVVQKAGMANACWKIQYEGELGIDIFKSAGDMATDGNGEEAEKEEKAEEEKCGLDSNGAAKDGGKLEDAENSKGIKDIKDIKENANTMVWSINENLNIPAEILLEMGRDELSRVSDKAEAIATVYRI